MQTPDLATALERVTQPLGEALGVKISILDGANAGAELHVGRRTFDIGASVDRDIVLLADDIADHHARVVISGALGSRATIEAVEQAVMIGDGDIVEVGLSVSVDLPVIITLGAARLSLEPRVSTSQAFGVVASLLGVGCVLYALSAGADFVLRAQPDTRPVVVAAANAPERTQAVRRCADFMRSELLKAGLSDQIAIEPTPTGQIVAKGSISARYADTWRVMLRRCDAEGSGGNLLNAVTVANGEPETPRVRSVWIDKTPHIVTSDGKSAGIGDTLAGGWLVRTIDANGVVLARPGGGLIRMQASASATKPGANLPNRVPISSRP